MENRPKFACKVCSRSHESPGRDIKTPIPANEYEKISNDFDKVEEMILSTAVDKIRGRQYDADKLASLEQKRDKLLDRLINANEGTRVWLLPETITTSKGPDGYYFHCADRANCLPGT